MSFSDKRKDSEEKRMPPDRRQQTTDGLPRFGNTDFTCKGEQLELFLRGPIPFKFNSPKEKINDATIHSKDIEIFLGIDSSTKKWRQMISRFFRSVRPLDEKDKV